LSQSVLRPFNWEERNAVSTLSFRLSGKESFGRRGYCCTLGYHRRAVGGRSRANAESQPYLWGPSPSRWGRASTLSAPDGARASQATRRVAYAEEATLIYFGSWNDARHRRRRPSPQVPTSKRQAGIPSKKINVCPEIACGTDAVVNRNAGTVRPQRPLSQRRWACRTGSLGS
jgi:hypothetical protein